MCMTYFEAPLTSRTVLSTAACNELPVADGTRMRSRFLESSPVHIDEETIEYDLMIRRHDWLLKRIGLNWRRGET